MSERILISGGRITDPANDLVAPGDLAIADGRIIAVGQAPDGFAPDRRIDASGCIVCPGLIDLCARLREPGLEHKGTIASETRIAAAAGITTLLCPPDTQPVIDTPAVANLIVEKAERAGFARVLPVGALTRELNGKELSEMRALKEAGCPAVSNADLPLANPLIWRRALEYAASHDLRVIIRPEDPWLRGIGCVHEGPVGTRLGLPGIPVMAETVALAQILAMLREIGTPVHFSRLSAARSVELLAEAQAFGLPVTADVSVRHLHWTDASVDGFDASAHVNPPFRSAADREALRDGVMSGVISAVCSDHRPHEPDAKLAAFPGTEIGESTLAELLPRTLALAEGNAERLGALIAALTVGPARALDLDFGSLSVGGIADVLVLEAETAAYRPKHVLLAGTEVHPCTS